MTISIIAPLLSLAQASPTKPGRRGPLTAQFGPRRLFPEVSGSVSGRERGQERAAADARVSEAAPPAPGAADILALQEAAGNHAVAGLIQRAPTFWDRVGMFFGAKTYEATVAGEKVVVASEAEEKEAGAIIKRITGNYGVDVSSLKAMKALKAGNKTAPKAMLDKITTRAWLFKELKALERALGHFAPILGFRRLASTRAKADQEILAVGKLETRLGVKAGKTVWKPTVLGTYFTADKTFAMYKHGETATPVFPTVEKEMEGTATHEIAHGVFQYAEDDWVKTFDYWRDADTASGKKGAEPPPTDYGQTSAGEDLAESVMLYFLDRAQLEEKCPLRAAFIQMLVEGWKPKPAPPKGDFPLPDPDPETALA